MFRGDGETVAHATVIAKMMGMGFLDGSGHPANGKIEL
jgi:hypothetical protein